GLSRRARRGHVGATRPRQSDHRNQGRPSRSGRHPQQGVRGKSRSDLEFGARGSDQGSRQKAGELKQKGELLTSRHAQREWAMPAVMRASAAYLPLLLLAFAWEAVARLNLVDSSALPPLSKVAVAWIDLVRGRELIDNGAASLYRGSVGLLLAIFGGGGLGLLMARWRLLDVFVNPLVELFYPLPKSALIPVTVLWLGFGDGSKILLIFLGCMIPVTIGAYNGARGSDHALVWSARSMGANRLRMMWDVI